ncbi:universal stress protein [Pseudochelatococcus contaminans]|uniref:Universal stress protein n=1 Tax=Pseudochelatococcus contaminans TaxID=1538103 RepID=A0A7W5Z5V9_9HYPH|nr:universal stress protein [Pseudochelatococcus contaminans]MBB3810031.1 nucleotide-binding universal stress UspA family protein [Pseudochelatococcus contaminans]
MFKKILVPVDLADLEIARQAVTRAAALARESGGTVRLIYIRSILPVSFVEFVPPNFDEEQARLAAEELAEFAKEVALPPERVSTVVRIGAVYNEVLEEAAEIGADLIVVSSHQPGVSTYLIGSNAATIVRHATSSVLVLRE